MQLERSPQHRPRRLLISVIVATLVGSLLTIASTQTPAAAQDTRPNIVVILMDDVRLDQLQTMPNTMALIRDQGVDFTMAATNAAECCPSRANLYTGQYNHNHRVYNSGLNYGWAAFDEQNTLPVWLDQAGYFTAFTGKYMNYYGDQAPAEVPPGWDDWYAGVGDTTYNYEYGEVMNTAGEMIDLPPGEYLTDNQNDHMVDLIETQSGETPFYIQYAPIASHVGFNVRGTGRLAWPWPADRDAGLLSSVPYPIDPSYNEPDNSDKPPRIASMPQYSATTLNGFTQMWRAAHESVMAVDDGVGMMVDALEASGELENTIFVVTSDNGYNYGEHRLWGKYWPYEGSVRVPLVMRGPGIPAGITRSHTVGLVDVTATIVEATEISPSLPLDGISLFPLIANGSLATDRVMTSEGGPPGHATGWRQARRGQQIFTRWEAGYTEFYDLAADPYQLENAIDDPAYASVIAQLESDLNVLDDCVGAGCRVGIPGYPQTVTAPVVGSVSPDKDIDAGGREITVYGNGFTGATEVRFGTTPSPSVTVVNDSEITAVAPPHAPGTVSITVTTPAGTSTAGLWSDSFQYLLPPPAPAVSLVSPTQLNALGGVEVTITGTNFTHVDDVTFDGVSGTELDVISPTQLTVVSPPNAAGPANVVVSDPWESAAPTSVTYITPAPQPTITKTTPNSGPATGGTSVTLTGTNFQYVTGITFGGTPAPTYTVNSPTSITVTAPPRPVGLINVEVTTWGGTTPNVAWKTFFNYVNASPPNLDSLSPNQGPIAGGQTVTLTGTNFTGATQVTFGGRPATSFTVVSPTQITATTPSYPSPYLVAVLVTTPAGTSVNEGWNTLYGYKSSIAPPNVDGRTPSSGPISGGTVVTINGTNFTGATQVTFGGAVGTALQVLSSTQIRVTTPPYSAPYLVAITVTGPGGTSPNEGWPTLFGYKSS